jgi:hypothetical protein
MSPPDDHDKRLDLYKLAVEMADRVSARRGTANGIFLTLHAGLVAAIGLVRPTTTQTTTVVRAGATNVTNVQTVDEFGLILTALFGLVLAAAWYRLLKSYRDLNNAKYKVINEIEEDLAVKPFTREWELLRPVLDNGSPPGADPAAGASARRRRRRYAELGSSERAVPVAFAVIYVAAIIRFLT